MNLPVRDIPGRWLGLAAAMFVLLGAGAAPESAPPPSSSPLFPFVLPWDDAAAGPTNVSAWLDRPAGGLGFVAVKDGHLFAGPKRLRLLGVNLAFGANFPTHADAAKVAARLARFGINAVRFHHMDMKSAPDGIFAADGRTLDPGQLDRLDFFIAELKARGIYADLNLHVSRTYPGLPTWDGMPDFHKGVDNVIPAMIDLQKQYARDLLLHRNPYTRTRYVDEPAVALIEINNENALIHEWWTGRLDEMPPAYANEFDRRWNDWLAAKYRDLDGIRRGWGVAETPVGAEILKNRDFGRGLDGWYLELHEDSKARAGRGEPTPGGHPTLRVEVEHPGKENWHVQLTQGKFKVEKGKAYTFELQARADRPRTIEVHLKQAHPPWENQWSTHLRLTPAWQSFRIPFAPSEGDDEARLGISGLAAAAGPVWFADASLKPGGTLGLHPTDQPGRIGFFKKEDFSSRTEGSQRDWIRFLWDLEARYWTGMSQFLKRELKAKGLVVGTQMGWSPFPIQAKLDVIDSHAYWQHPDFHGKDWNPDDWTVRNLPMAGIAGGGTLPGLGLSRVAGKPFLCTEYNHAAPSTYGSEGFLLLASYAAMQDWDGIFAFAYSHRHDDWDARRITGFFDIDQHPTKMATLPAAAALFLRGDLATDHDRLRTALATVEAAVDQVRRSGPGLGAHQFGLPRDAALRDPVAVTLDPDRKSDRASARPRDGHAWDWSGKGVLTIQSPRSLALIGEAAPGSPVRLGDWTVTPGPTRQRWLALTITALDGRDLRSPGRVLVTATGDAENTAMGWKDRAKSTVGRDWGRAPSVVEGIPATLGLPFPSAKVHAWALDERGQRKAALSPTEGPATTSLSIGPALKTLWYEIEIGR